MNLINVTYDLNAPGKDYHALVKALESFSSWCRPTKSQWILETNLSAAAVYEFLRAFVDANDALLVVELTREMAGHGLAPKVADWINSRLAAARQQHSLHR